MLMLSCVLLVVLSLFSRLIHGHIAIFHPSMWGFNVTQQTYSYDNRPVAPLMNMTFDQWWFHGHLDHPPNPDDFFELPAGETATTQLACDKSATTFFASSEGGDIQNGDDPCPGSPISEYHTTGINDLFGCSLAIAYKSNVSEVQPEDFSVFSVNQTCVWTRFTDFQVPQRMPPCPEGGCICAWFWIHSPDSGGEQNYMNGFQCNVTGSTSNVALATSQIPRRCGADPANGKMQADPGNCTYGAKQPFYWFQQERNNMFEGTYSPPRYLDMYNFKDGAQDDIFADSYPSGLPSPGPNSTVVPTPFLGGANPAQTSTLSVSSPISSASTVSVSNPPISSSSSSLVGTSASSDSAASSLATISTSLDPASLTPSLSISVSTATVISTAVVTVTQLPSSLPLSPSSTATVVNTVVVTVVESVPSSSTVSPPSTTASPVSTSTIIVFATASPPVITNAAFAQLDQIAEDDASVDPSGSSTATSLSSPIESVGNESRMCKRSASSSEPPLRRRTASSYFSLSGVGRHRKMQKRSNVWNIVF